jgi:IS66 Orf2 like protein
VIARFFPTAHLAVNPGTGQSVGDAGTQQEMIDTQPGIVYWQRNGLCLWSKRLEGRDRFIFPRHNEGETVTIRGEQLEELLAGFDL